MAKLRDPWSETPADNDDPPPVGAPEGNFPSTNNDIQRNMMAGTKELGDEFDALIDRASLEPGYTLPPTLGDMAYQISTSVAITGGTMAGTHSGDGSGLSGVDAANLGGAPASSYARTDIAETFDGDVTVSADLATGKDTGGSSIHNFWDDTADAWRPFQWTNGIGFQLTDGGGVLRDPVTSGNIGAQSVDNADNLGTIPAADYMRKDIAQTMAGALIMNGLATINDLANAGDIQSDTSGSGGWLEVGDFAMAWGTGAPEALSFGYTFGAAPQAIFTTPLASAGPHYAYVDSDEPITTTGCNINTDAPSYFFVAMGAKA